MPGVARAACKQRWLRGPALRRERQPCHYSAPRHRAELRLRPARLPVRLLLRRLRLPLPQPGRLRPCLGRLARAKMGPHPPRFRPKRQFRGLLFRVQPQVQRGLLLHASLPRIRRKPRPPRVPPRRKTSQLPLRRSPLLPWLGPQLRLANFPGARERRWSGLHLYRQLCLRPPPPLLRQILQLRSYRAAAFARGPNPLSRLQAEIQRSLATLALGEQPDVTLSLPIARLCWQLQRTEVHPEGTSPRWSRAHGSQKGPLAPL